MSESLIIASKRLINSGKRCIHLSMRARNISFGFSLWVVLLAAFRLHAQTAVNIDFETMAAGAYSSSNSVSGWTLSSATRTTCGNTPVFLPGSAEFSIISTPAIAVPYVGTLPNSPLGGNKVANLNNGTANSSITKLSQTFSVSPTTNFIFAYAGYAQGGTHTCCDEAGFLMNFKDVNGNVLSCQALTMTAGSASCSNVTNSVSSNAVWKNWELRYFDLSSFLGSTITVEVTAKDCPFNDHAASLYFDATTTNTYAPGTVTCFPIQYFTGWTQTYCPSSNSLVLSAPPGATGYTWTAPAIYTTNPLSANGQYSVTVTNPIAYSQFTVDYYDSFSCSRFSTVEIVPQAVSILGINTSTSCIGGNSGSAIVFGAGGNGQYSYTWTNASNAVVGTGSVLNNVPAGVYSVAISATNNSLCGQSGASLTILSGSNNLVAQLFPYCGTSATLSAPGSGTNYQWYNNLSAIAGTLGGNNSYYAVYNILNGMSFMVSYDGSLGCRDSIRYTLISVPPGSFSLTYSRPACFNTASGAAVFSISPWAGIPSSTFNWSVVSTGTTSAFSNSTASSISTQTFVNLLPGTYSIVARDAGCTYGSSFTISAFSFSYGLSALNSNSCAGSPVILSTNLGSGSSPGQYTYSWSPTNWMVSSNTSLNALITPSNIPTNSVASVIYTMIVTPTVVNCPLSETISVSAANPAVPVVTATPSLCSNGSTVALLSVPGNLSYSGNQGLSANGIISPNQCLPGINSFTAINSVGGCSVSTTGSFTVLQASTVSLTGPSLVCAGQAVNYTASGNAPLNWSNGQSGTSITFSTLTNTVLSVTAGSNTSCPAIQTLSVTTVAKPIIQTSGSNSLCAGQSLQLLASGASSYFWSNGSSSPNLTMTPVNSTTLTLYGYSQNNICYDSLLVFVTVVPLPNLNVSGNASICAGSSATLSASGANSYSWSNSSTASSIVVSPSATAVFTVTGYDSFLICSTSKTVSIVVIPIPSLTIIGSTTLCIGGVASLSVTGANSYTWSNGGLSNTVAVASGSTQTFSVTGSNLFCSSTASVNFTSVACTDLPMIEETGVIVFPNPCSDYLHLTTITSGYYKIISTHNVEVARFYVDQTTQQIDISDLRNGIYFLHPEKGKPVKLVIAH